MPASRTLAGRVAAVLAALAAAVLGLALVAPASPASAHDTLLRSSPADGEQLAAAPAEWTLEFSAEILAVGSEALLLDEQGQRLELGELEIDGATVTIPLGTLPEGSYTGQWRVVSSDGHPISGTVVFGVGVPAGQAVQPAAAGSASPQGAPGSGEQAPGSTTSNPAEAQGLPAWAIALIGIAALGAMIAGGIAILGRGRRDALLDEVERSQESTDQE